MQRYVFKVTKVAIKQFGEIVTTFSGQTIAETENKAYANLLCQAKKQLKLSQTAKLTFDKKKIEFVGPYLENYKRS